MPVLLDLAGRLPRDVAVGVGLPEDVAVGARFPEDWTGVPGKFSGSIVCYRAADKIWSTNGLQLPELGLGQISGRSMKSLIYMFVHSEMHNIEDIRTILYGPVWNTWNGVLRGRKVTVMRD